MTIFKRRFGDYLPMAKARCEYYALKFDPFTQKLHEVLDVLQNTAEEAKPADQKPKNSSTKLYMPRCPTTLRRY